MPIFASTQIKFIQKNLSAVFSGTPRELVEVEFNGGLRRDDKICMECKEKSDCNSHRHSDDESKRNLGSGHADWLQLHISLPEAGYEWTDCECNTIETSTKQVEKKKIKELVIVESDTIPNPWTKVVHSQNLPPCYVTIVRAVWLELPNSCRFAQWLNLLVLG